jgi:hypothetical protein
VARPSGLAAGTAPAGPRQVSGIGRPPDSGVRARPGQG